MKRNKKGKYRIFYWLEVPNKWFYKGKWHDVCQPGSCSCRDIKTAEKAFKALDNAPSGSILTRFVKPTKEGWLTQTWERI